VLCIYDIVLCIYDTVLYIYDISSQICGKMFGEAGNMKRHILHVHNSQHVPKRMCPHCNKEFTTKNNLIQAILGQVNCHLLY